MKKYFLFAFALLMAAGAQATTYNLSNYPSNLTLTLADGDEITGTLINDVTLKIAKNATVTLNNVTINPDGEISPTGKDMHSAIHANGDAKILLKGENSVYGFGKNAPGIYIEKSHTLTIEAHPSDPNGSLYAKSIQGAGIGSGPKYTYYAIFYNMSCGNIVINSGNVKALSYGAAAIGGAFETSCGNITINGGRVEATTMSYYAPGIGSGLHKTSSGSRYWSECGTITINGGVVIASGGFESPGIGAGDHGKCGQVVINEGVDSLYISGGVGSIGKGNGDSFGGLLYFGTSWPNGHRNNPLVYPNNTTSCSVATDILTTDVTATTAKVSWKKSSNAVNYNVAYNCTYNGQTVKRTASNITDNQYKLTNLHPNTTYTLYVVTNCKSGNKLVSDPYSLTTEASTITDELCPMPTDFTATNITKNGLTLSWEPGSDSQEKWEIKRVKDGDWDYTSFFTTTEPNYTFEGLVGGSTYDFYVREICSQYDPYNPSSWTEAISITTPTDVCEKPNSLIAENVTSTKATILWEPGFVDQNKWRLYFRLKGTSNWTARETNETNYELTSLTPGKTYEINVKSVCTSGDSDFAGTMTFQTLPSAESIEQVLSDDTWHNGSKVIINGQLYIKYNSKLYDVRGNEVR